MEIRDNLLDRIAEAEREGWLGEIEGLQASLAGAESKISQIDASTAGGPDIVRARAAAEAYPDPLPMRPRRSAGGGGSWLDILDVFN